MRTAIYPGSFDPITKGHLDVLEKASVMFDRVIIAVFKNPDKKGFLPVSDRVELIKKSTSHLLNVDVDHFDGLTIDYAHQKEACVLIRGLRAVSDFEYEMQLSQTNSALAPDITTVFLITKPEYNFISSGIVRQLVNTDKDVSPFVPLAVVEYLKNMKEVYKKEDV